MKEKRLPVIRQGEKTPEGPYIWTDGEVWKLVTCGPAFLPPRPQHVWVWRNTVREWVILTLITLTVSVGQHSWHPMVLVLVAWAFAWARHLAHKIKQWRRWSAEGNPWKRSRKARVQAQLVRLGEGRT